MCGVARAVLSVACHIHCPAVQFLVNTVQKSHCATPLFSSLSVTCSFSSFKVNWQGVCLSTHSRLPMFLQNGLCICVCKFLSAGVNGLLCSIYVWTQLTGDAACVCLVVWFHWGSLCLTSFLRELLLHIHIYFYKYNTYFWQIVCYFRSI